MSELTKYSKIKKMCSENNDTNSLEIHIKRKKKIMQCLERRLVIILFLFFLVLYRAV